MTESRYDTTEPESVIRCRKKAMSEIFLQVEGMCDAGEMHRHEADALLRGLFRYNYLPPESSARNDEINYLIRKISRMYLRKRLTTWDFYFFMRELMQVAGPFHDNVPPP